jgi:hypothetical protein
VEADGGGGGAGGFRESVPSPAAWTASPLANPGGALPVSVQQLIQLVVEVVALEDLMEHVVIHGNTGNNSIFSTITSAGGGGGKGSPGPSSWTTGPGGSGGGGGFSCSWRYRNTPPVVHLKEIMVEQGLAPSNGAGGGGAGGTYSRCCFSWRCRTKWQGDQVYQIQYQGLLLQIQQVEQVDMLKYTKFTRTSK